MACRYLYCIAKVSGSVGFGLAKTWVWPPKLSRSQVYLHIPRSFLQNASIIASTRKDPPPASYQSSHLQYNTSLSCMNIPGFQISLLYTKGYPVVLDNTRHRSESLDSGCLGERGATAVDHLSYILRERCYFHGFAMQS